MGDNRDTSAERPLTELLEAGASEGEQELPLLPVRDLVVFPFMVVPLYVDRDLSMRAIEEAVDGERHLFMVAQKDPGADLPGPDDIHEFGTLGKVLKMRRLNDNRSKILVQGLSRARLLEVTQERPYLRARVMQTPEDIISAEPELEGLMRVVRELLGKLQECGRGLPNEVMTVLNGLEEPGSFADLVASNLGLKVPDAQVVLRARHPGERLRRVIELVTKEVEVATWQQKIRSQAKEEMSRIQRDYFLRQQLKQIRSELGDVDAKTEEIDELRAKLDAAKLPDEAVIESQKQLRRLDTMSPESAEATIVRTYLDWLSELPWSRESEDLLDLARAQRVLDEDHYGLETIKERILEYLGVLKLNKYHKGPILCFVGPPGVGKTSLGRSIARSIGRAFVQLSLGGLRDEAEIRGHRRTYVGAMPGRIISSLKRVGTRNPVFVLDELDKVGSDARGDPASALLEVLDPEQNHSFRDNYLNLAFDLSRVLWVATANVVDPIPAALRDRMEIIPLSGYHLQEKLEIAERYLVPKQRDSAGLTETDLKITRPAVEAMIELYTREAGVRNLDRQIASVARKVARRFAEGTTSPVRVGKKEVAKYLGPPQHNPERPSEADLVGLATGLAWTEAGGAILHVEATAMPGPKGLLLTGQLGKVMKESAQAALSCVRSRALSFGVSEHYFREHEFHVHVPQGAIPKDGPSAGITIAVALLSMATGCPVRSDAAMTGEITLRGRVLGVGGLKSKILAAVRANMRDVIVPQPNEADLSEIPQALRQKVRVHIVRDIDEVVDFVLVGFRERERALPQPPLSQPPGRA